MTEVTIRKAGITDIDNILNIERESINSWTFDQFIQELGYNFSLFLVAEVNDSICGYIIAWKVADEIQLNSIAVKNDWRRHGIATMLISELLKVDPDNQYLKILCEVRSSNYGALDFYFKNGFRKTGVRKKYYVDDDAVLMEKSI
jgi:ribosomal-protein-alanine N-acetyltransferase